MVLVVAVAWLRLRAPFGSDHGRYHNRTFTCLRVVDGDTLDIDAPDGWHERTRIRLWGVDTPETARDDQPAMHFGPQAKDFARRLVEGRPVRVVLLPGRTRDRYGRLLAYVYPADSDDERMLNEALIAEGYGYADRRFKHPWRVRFADLEARARKHKLGLWADVRPEQMPPWRQRYEPWQRSVNTEQGEATSATSRPRP